LRQDWNVVFSRRLRLFALNTLTILDGSMITSQMTFICQSDKQRMGNDN